jgi:peptidoglycan/LPS O-acetylase OafA/YrhL
VEEQFYVIWPVAALCLVVRRGRRAVLLAAVLGTAGSIAALVILNSWQRWVDGYPARSTDGLHFDAAGGTLLADRLLPVIRKVAGLRPTPGS